MKNILLIVFICFFPLTSLDKNNDDLNKYEVEIAEIGKAGTLVIRTWCYNKKAVISDDKFKECAIKGVLFKGLDDSGRMKGRKALVEAGYESHKDYFDSFFKKGEYQKYARIAMDGYVEENNIMKVGKLYKVAKLVVVSYNDLRSRLEKDNIIKGLNNGF